MMRWLLTFVLISFISLCWSVGLYQQCGGEGYKGSTSCDWPFGCFRRSRWFSSCQVSCPAADWECARLGGNSGGSGLAKAWDQCGGEGWNGPRGCVEYPCQWRTKWYAQCRPDCPTGWLCKGSVVSSTRPSTQPSVSITLPLASSSTFEPTEPDSGELFENSSPYIPLSTESPVEETLGWEIGNITHDMLGRRIVAHMLGSNIFEEILSEDDDVYDLIVSHIVELLESEEPGSMANFGLAMMSEDLNERIEAWTIMSDRVEMISDTAELVAELFLDPHFLDLIQSTDFMINRRTLRSGSKGCDGVVPDLGRVNGKYGDGKEGMNGALSDTGKWLTTWLYEKHLREIDRDGKKPTDMDSRLGAYYATRTYPRGTVGNAVHRAIGELYRWFGPVGEERIGRVFNDPRATALYPKSVESSANLCMAQIEHRYWANVLSEDGLSIGGKVGAMFQPAARDCIQQYLPTIRECLQLSTEAVRDCLERTASLVSCGVGLLLSERQLKNQLDNINFIQPGKQADETKKVRELRLLSDSQRNLVVPSGYTKTNYRCMNKPVYCNPKAKNALACIVEDRASHKGGFWKAGPEKAWAEKDCPTSLRSGTYDASSNWIAS